MGKKSQITLFFILGLVIAVVLSFYMFTIYRQNQERYRLEVKQYWSVSEMRIDLSSYIESCLNEAAVSAIQETGIREETKEEYEEIVSSKVKECAGEMLDILEKEQGYTITRGEPEADAELSDEIISIILNYPLEIEANNQKTRLDIFQTTFDRTTYFGIAEGVVNDIIIYSPDRKAELSLPAGVVVTDEDGNRQAYVGIKVEDLHFDGLRNGAVVGNTIYNGLPDGTRFSEPVTITLEFDEADIPEGYGKEDLFVAWWDKEFGIWMALPTLIDGNRASAKLNHFTEISIVGLRSITVLPSKYDDFLFHQRYSYCPPPSEELPNQQSTLPCECGKDYWDYAEESEDNPLLIMREDPSFYDDVLETGILNSEGVDYRANIFFGFSEENDYKDCMEGDGIQDFNDGNPVITARTFPRIECTSGLDVVTGFDGNCISKIAGVYIGTDNCLYCMVTSAEGQCTCISEDSQDYEIPGWIDYRCAGGKVEAEEDMLSLSSHDYDNGWAELLIFLDSGDSAVYEQPEEFQAFEETLFVNEGFFYPFVTESSAKCRLIKYGDGHLFHRIYNLGYPAYGVKGVIAENDEVDPCAACGIAWRISAEGLYARNLVT